MKTDSEIQKDVMAELKWEPLLTASEIGVAVKNGIVTLSGIVNTYTKKVTAEKAAKRVIGVKAVAEDIVVKLSDTGKKTDAEIAEAVVNGMRWDSSVPDTKIKTTVENGWVTLEGEVEWEFQRSAARSVAERTSGVSGVITKIKITPSLKPSDIKSKINAAFHRSATLDSEKVQVVTDGSKVTITGKVRSLAEKNDAERAAWLAPGVNSVVNNLEVDLEVYAY